MFIFCSVLFLYGVLYYIDSDYPVIWVAYRVLEEEELAKISAKKRKIHREG